MWMQRHTRPVSKRHRQARQQCDWRHRLQGIVPEMRRIDPVARTLYMAGVLLVTLVSFGVEPLRRFFDFTVPNITLLWPGIAVVVIVALAQWYLARRAGRKFKATEDKYPE